MYLLYLLHKSFFFLGLGVNRYRATTPSHTCIYTVRAHPFRLRFRLFFHHLLFCWAIMRHFGLTKTMNVRGEIKKGGLGRNLITARLNLLNIEGQRDEIGISILCVWFAQVLVFYPQNTPCEPSVLRKNIISFLYGEDEDKNVPNNFYSCGDPTECRGTDPYPHRKTLGDGDSPKESKEEITDYRIIIEL